MKKECKFIKKVKLYVKAINILVITYFLFALGFYIYSEIRLSDGLISLLGQKAETMVYNLFNFSNNFNLIKSLKQNNISPSPEIVHMQLKRLFSNEDYINNLLKEYKNLLLLKETFQNIIKKKYVPSKTMVIDILHSLNLHPGLLISLENYYTSSLKYYSESKKAFLYTSLICFVIIIIFNIEFKYKLAKKQKEEANGS